LQDEIIAARARGGEGTIAALVAEKAEEKRDITFQ
jgi:hypothetical protein